jgi:hypothetical protein
VDEAEVVEMMIFHMRVGARDDAPSAISKHNTTKMLRVDMLLKGGVVGEVMVYLLW